MQFAKNRSECSNLLLDDKTIAPEKLFSCRLSSTQPLAQQLLKHYKVMPIFEPETGRYACQIDLTSDFNTVLTIVKTNDVHFELKVVWFGFECMHLTIDFCLFSSSYLSYS